MTAKSIVEVEINDSEFVKFQAMFAKYQSQLKDQPSAWDKVNKAMKKANTPFGKIGAIMTGTTAQIKAATTYQQKFNIAAQGGAKSMTVVAKSSAAVSKNIAKATISLLKFASITGIVSGLFGGGTLFGIERLAASASNSRRQSQGLGLKAGDLRSAQVNFGKFVDVDSTLEGVANTRSDLGKRWIYSSMGVDPEKGSNVDVMAASMKAAKHIFEQNGMTQQGAEARGLTELFGMDDLRRLHEMTDQEIDDAVAKQQADRKALDISDQSQKSWQDLKIQLDRAGATIENVLTNKLGTLSEPLTKLSGSVAKAFETFADSPKVAEWIDSLGGSIEKFAKYLVTDEFQTNSKNFIKSIGDLADDVTRIVKFLAHPIDSLINPEKPASGAKPPLGSGKLVYGAPAWYNGWNYFAPDQGASKSAAVAGGTSGSLAARNNNPGNMRSWGKTPVSGGFAKFANVEDGISAMASQLQLYSKRGTNTLSGIINKWAPSSENDTDAYLANVVKRTGYGANDQLDMNNRQVIAKVISAMAKQEDSKTSVTQDSVASTLLQRGIGRDGGGSAAPVLIEIRNNTGGSAVVTTNALAY